MDIETIRELVRLMSEHDLAEIRIRNGSDHVALRRRMLEPLAPPIPRDGFGQPVLTGPAPGPLMTVPAPPVEEPDPNAGLVPIASPMVGTFYAAPNPQAPPFVDVGTVVGHATVVCIIEAMKVFNEIKAEMAGVVAKVLVPNGAAIEYGQPLFLVRPNA